MHFASQDFDVVSLKCVARHCVSDRIKTLQESVGKHRIFVLIKCPVTLYSVVSNVTMRCIPTFFSSPARRRPSDSKIFSPDNLSFEQRQGELIVSLSFLLPGLVQKPTREEPPASTTTTTAAETEIRKRN